MAELHARQALELADLDGHVPLSRMSSVTNEVWRTPDHIVRLAPRGSTRLSREATIAELLPEAAGYPEIVYSSRDSGRDVMITRRIAGTPLAHAWPVMEPAARRDAVQQIAHRLRAIHSATADGLEMVSGPQLLDLNRADHLTEPTIWALERAGSLDHVDSGLVADAVAMVRSSTATFDDGPYRSLIHGDMHFENVLWDGKKVRALLDFEFCRTGPPDLELDVFIRMCALPEMFVGAGFEESTDASHYWAVPDWMRDAYPEIFSHPRVGDRLRVYSLAFDVRELLEFPPNRSSHLLADSHPLRRIEQTVAGTAPLDEWLSRW